MKVLDGSLVRAILALSFLLLATAVLVLALKYQPQAHAFPPAFANPAAGEVGWTTVMHPGGKLWALAWKTSTGESQVYVYDGRWGKVDSPPRNPFE